MKKTIKIRKETAGDYCKIDNILRSCFQSDKSSEEFNEWVLVRKIRGCKEYIPDLALVAEEDGRIIGFVMFSVCKIGEIISAALAPLAVIPEKQSCGVGAELVETGLQIAFKNGF